MVELTLRTAIVIIVSVAVLVVMFPWAAHTYETIPEAFTSSECRASVVWHAKTGVDILDFESPLPLECATKTIYLKYDETGRKKDENLLSPAPTYYISKRDEQKIKKIFAESWAMCLWQMADGEEDVFRGRDKARCVICFDLIVDEDIVDPDKGNIQVLNNFENYIESNKFSKTKTYYKDYLSVIPDMKFSDILLADEGKPISYTFFYSSEKVSAKKRAQTKSLLAAGAVIGVHCLGGAVIGFFAGGVGAIPGFIAGCKAGVVSVKLVGLAAAGGAVYGWTTDGEHVWFVGYLPIYEVSSKCQGLF